MEFVPDHGCYLRLHGTSPQRLILDLVRGLEPDDHASLDDGLVIERDGHRMAIDSIVSLRDGLTEVLVESPTPGFLEQAVPTVWKHAWNGRASRRILVHDGQVLYDEHCTDAGQWTVCWKDQELRADSLSSSIRDRIALALDTLRNSLGDAALVLDDVSTRPAGTEVDLHEAELRQRAVRFDMLDLDEDDIPF